MKPVELLTITSSCASFDSESAFSLTSLLLHDKSVTAAWKLAAKVPNLRFVSCPETSTEQERDSTQGTIYILFHLLLHVSSSLRSNERNHGLSTALLFLQRTSVCIFSSLWSDAWIVWKDSFFSRTTSSTVYITNNISSHHCWRNARISFLGWDWTSWNQTLWTWRWWYRRWSQSFSRIQRPLGKISWIGYWNGHH